MISIGCDVPKTSARKKIIVAVYTIRRQKGISNLTDIFRKGSFFKLLIFEMRPSNFYQRVPLYIGSKKEMETREEFFSRKRKA